MMAKTKQPILVFGSAGQVGKALKKRFAKKQAVFFERKDLNLENHEAIPGVLDSHDPCIVINAAAYTNVDGAESDIDTAFKVNSLAPGEIAKWCNKNKVPFIHFSTNYVFDGTGNQPRLETDLARPINQYGASKLDGENRILENFPDAIILRTSWVYDEYGKNFFNTMLKLGSENEILKIVDDQIGSPTYAGDLAETVLEIIKLKNKSISLPGGVFHITSNGETTWAGFAEEIFKIARTHKAHLKVKEIMPVSTDEFPSPATRPLNSMLNLEKIKKTFGIELPHWKESLVVCTDGKFNEN